MFSAFNPSKCTHLEQWAADCAAPGEQSWESSPAGAGIRTHNLGLPRVSSPTLYPLGQRLPNKRESALTFSGSIRDRNLELGEEEGPASLSGV